MAGLVADAGEAKSQIKRSRARPRIRALVAIIVLVSTVGVAALALYPTQPAQGRPQSESNPCDCHPYGPDSLLTLIGIPTAYSPGATYTITVSVNDLNGLTGNNSFVMDITGGGIMTAAMQTDPNIEINTVNTRASVNDTMLPMHVATWDVVWQAPLSGDVTFNVTAVSANDAATGIDAPKDSDQVTISPTAIPEFPVLLVPMIAIIGLLVVMRVAVKR